jgi:hypothetical protein
MHNHPPAPYTSSTRLSDSKEPPYVEIEPHLRILLTILQCPFLYCDVLHSFLIWQQVLLLNEQRRISTILDWTIYQWAHNRPQHVLLLPPVHGTFVTMVSHWLVRKIVVFRMFPWQQRHVFSHGVSQCPPPHRLTYSSYSLCTAFPTMGNSNYRCSTLRPGHVCVPMERLGFRSYVLTLFYCFSSPTRLSEIFSYSFKSPMG